MLLLARHENSSGFDNLAQVYDLLGDLVFGGGIRRATAWSIKEMHYSKNILIVGGGTGRLLEDLPRQKLKAEITYLEPSGRMMAIAQKRWKNLAAQSSLHIHWVQDDDSYVQQINRYDVIITPFVMDLFDDKKIGGVFSRFDRALTSGGYWCYSDFYVKSDEVSFLRKALIGSMYVFFRFFSAIQAQKLPDIHVHFKDRGYQSLRRNTFSRSMIESIVFQKP